MPIKNLYTKHFENIPNLKNFRALLRFTENFAPLYDSIRTALTRCCTMCHCDEYKLLALQVRRLVQNTELHARTEQFITTKVSANALKQGIRTHLVLCQRSSQLQKYKAAHYNSGEKHTQRNDRAVCNHQKIRLRECLVEQQSSKDMRLGWRTPRVDSLKPAKLHTN